MSASTAEGDMITASNDDVYVALVIASDDSYEGYIALSVTVSSSLD